jgi:hypothetical protein
LVDDPVELLFSTNRGQYVANLATNIFGDQFKKCSDHASDGERSRAAADGGEPT